jgi:hypothetical protein
LKSYLDSLSDPQVPAILRLAKDRSSGPSGPSVLSPIDELKEYLGTETQVKRDIAPRQRADTGLSKILNSKNPDQVLLNHGFLESSIRPRHTWKFLTNSHELVQDIQNVKNEIGTLSSDNSIIPKLEWFMIWFALFFCIFLESSMFLAMGICTFAFPKKSEKEYRKQLLFTSLGTVLLLGILVLPFGLSTYYNFKFT